MPLEVDICELMTEQTSLVKALLNKYVKFDAQISEYGSIECTDDFVCGPGRVKRLVHFKSSLALLQEFKTIHSRYLHAQDKCFISATCIHEMRDACDAIAAAEFAVLKMTLDEKLTLCAPSSLADHENVINLTTGYLPPNVETE